MNYKVSLRIMVDKDDEILQDETLEKLNKLKNKNQDMIESYLKNYNIKYDSYSFLWESDAGDVDHYGELFTCDISSNNLTVYTVYKEELKELVQQMYYFDSFNIVNEDDDLIIKLVKRDNHIKEIEN